MIVLPGQGSPSRLAIPAARSLLLGSRASLAQTGRDSGQGQAQPERGQPATLIDLPRLLTDARFRRQQISKVEGDLALGGFWAWYETLSPQAQASSIAAEVGFADEAHLIRDWRHFTGGTPARWRDDDEYAFAE
jgi:AraC-like DNA-binding protein